MVMVLAPLHVKFRLKRVVVSTYQAVTGTGKDAVRQLMDERNNITGPKVYPHPIDFNTLPHIDSFLDNGYTKEEMKIVNETRKILGDNTIGVTATAVRVPTGGHAESVNAEFYHDFACSEIRAILASTPGVIVQDDPKNNMYPMPINTAAAMKYSLGASAGMNPSPTRSICGLWPTTCAKALPPMPYKLPSL